MSSTAAGLPGRVDSATGGTGNGQCVSGSLTSISSACKVPNVQSRDRVELPLQHPRPLSTPANGSQDSRLPALTPANTPELSQQAWIPSPPAHLPGAEASHGIAIPALEEGPDGIIKQEPAEERTPQTLIQETNDGHVQTCINEAVPKPFLADPAMSLPEVESLEQTCLSTPGSLPPASNGSGQVEIISLLDDSDVENEAQDSTRQDPPPTSGSDPQAQEDKSGRKIDGNREPQSETWDSRIQRVFRRHGEGVWWTAPEILSELKSLNEPLGPLSNYKTKQALQKLCKDGMLQCRNDSGSGAEREYALPGFMQAANLPAIRITLGLPKTATGKRPKTYEDKDRAREEGNVDSSDGDFDGELGSREQLALTRRTRRRISLPACGPADEKLVDVVVKAMKAFPKGEFLTAVQIGAEMQRQGYQVKDYAPLQEQLNTRDDLFLSCRIYSTGVKYALLDDLPCQVCRSTDSSTGNEMVLCDRCSRGWHLRCMPQQRRLRSIPEGDWFCWECSQLMKNQAMVAVSRKKTIVDALPVPASAQTQQMNGSSSYFVVKFRGSAEDGGLKQLMIFHSQGPRLLVVAKEKYQNSSTFKYWSLPSLEGPPLGVVTNIAAVKKWLAKRCGAPSVDIPEHTLESLPERLRFPPARLFAFPQQDTDGRIVSPTTTGQPGEAGGRPRQARAWTSPSNNTRAYNAHSGVQAVVPAAEVAGPYFMVTFRSPAADGGLKQKMIFHRQGPRLLVVAKARHRNISSYMYWSLPSLEGPPLGIVTNISAVKKWLAKRCRASSVDIPEQALESLPERLRFPPARVFEFPQHDELSPFPSFHGKDPMSCCNRSELSLPAADGPAPRDRCHVTSDNTGLHQNTSAMRQQAPPQTSTDTGEAVSAAGTQETQMNQKCLRVLSTPGLRDDLYAKLVNRLDFEVVLQILASKEVELTNVARDLLEARVLTDSS